MSIYVSEAKDATLLSSEYVDLVTLDDEDVLNEQQVEELLEQGESDSVTQMIQELTAQAIAYEATDVMTRLSELWDVEHMGPFDELSALDEISLYINDHLNQDVQEELILNTEPAVVRPLLSDNVQ